MSGRSLATGACLLAGLLGGGACADRSPSTPSTQRAADCQWTATPSVPWIRVVYNTARGTGDSTIYVSVVDWNNGSTAKVGDVVVAGLSGVNHDAHLVVTQAGR